MNKVSYSVIVPPAYTGVAFLFCWTYLMFYATSAGIEAAAPISLYSVGYSISAVFMLGTLLAVAFFVKHRRALLTSIGVKIATGIALPLGTALLIAYGQTSVLPFAVIGGVITGVFSGIMLMQWIVAYQRVGLRVAASSFPMLMAMSVGVCVTLMHLPSIAMTAATVGFPLISELMFHEVRKNPWPRFEDEAADVWDRPINFVLMLLPFTVYAIASGFLDFSSGNNNYTFAFYAFGAFIPVIISGVYLFIAERNDFVVAFLVPLSFLVAVCVPFLTMRELVPFSPFISIGELGIEVLIFIVPIGFAEFFSIDSLKTYALARTVYVVFNGVGWCLAQVAYQTYGQLMHSQVSLVFIFIGVEVLAVCLIVAIVKAQKSLPEASGPAPSGDGEKNDDADGELPFKTTADNAKTNFSSGVATNLNSQVAASQADDSGSKDSSDDVPLGDGEPADVKKSGIETSGALHSSANTVGETSAATEADADEVATRISQDYGLSQRERDVFMLLARGYTSSRIQKELYIAAGTVNYHSRNIYAKLGVHSKQELIELFEKALQPNSTL